MSAPLKEHLRNLSTERVGVKVRRIKNLSCVRTREYSCCLPERLSSISSAFALGYHFHRSNCTAWEWSIHTEKPLRVMCKEKEVPAAGTFVITAETIDPFHIILDMF